MEQVISLPGNTPALFMRIKSAFWYSKCAFNALVCLGPADFKEKKYLGYVYLKSIPCNHICTELYNSHGVTLAEVFLTDFDTAFALASF